MVPTKILSCTFLNHEDGYHFLSWAWDPMWNLFENASAWNCWAHGNQTFMKWSFIKLMFSIPFLQTTLLIKTSVDLLQVSNGGLWELLVNYVCLEHEQIQKIRFWQDYGKNFIMYQNKKYYFLNILFG